MDTLTHIALGALAGEALAGKKLGKKAMLVGAAAQSLPDIDFVAALWLSPAENLLAHRGFTHSFTFLILITPLLAWLASRWRVTGILNFRAWIYFFCIQLLIHLGIDSLNAYGIGWFVPFLDYRFSFHLLFVADLFFSVPLALACLALFFVRSSRSRAVWTFLGLMTSALYIVMALNNKFTIVREIRHAHETMNIKPIRSIVTPTPLNNWLWYAVAEVDSGYHASYHSVFDKRPDTTFTFFYRNDSLLNLTNDPGELQSLLQFSNGYYTVEQWGDTLVFNDLRFGQMAGWTNRNAKFAFHYYLQHPDENKFVIQRGRFAHWNKETIESLIRRIDGN